MTLTRRMSTVISRILRLIALYTPIKFLCFMLVNISVKLEYPGRNAYAVEIEKELKVKISMDPEE